MSHNKSLRQMAKESLESKYIKVDDLANIISLAVAGRTNAIIFGPAGHGKSEMALDALLGLGYTEDDLFIQFFGEGMEESRLYGGINFKKLDEERIIEFNTDRSFLNKRAAIFEELFDAPAKVLLSLKDTMTARRLRNGAQQVNMQTDVIIALTNRDPREIADMGPAAQALIERFPLQLHLQWGTYDAPDFKAMFDKVAPRVMGGMELEGVSDVLSDLSASAIKEGATISPRTAVWALGLLRASVEARGGRTITAEDFSALQFIPAFEPCIDTIKKTIASQLEAQKCSSAISDARLRADDLAKTVEENIKMIDAKLITKESTEQQVLSLINCGGKIQLLREALNSIKMIDSMISARAELDAKLSSLAKDAAQALNKASLAVSE